MTNKRDGITGSAAPATPCLCGATVWRQSLALGSGETIWRCGACGLGRTWPPPYSDERASGEYEGHTEDRAVRFGDLALWRGFAGKTLDFIESADRNRAGGDGAQRRRLLDVGCHVGALVLEARERGWDAEGIDIDAGAVQLGGERLDVPLRVGDIRNEPPCAEYDAVTLSHTLEHIVEPISFLRACAARLAPGGVLAIVVPNWGGLLARVYGRRWYGLQPHQHVWHFTPQSLRQVVERAGLRVTAWSARRGLHYERGTGSMLKWGVLRSLISLASATNRADQVVLIARNPED